MSRPKFSAPTGPLTDEEIARVRTAAEARRDANTIYPEDDVFAADLFDEFALRLLNEIAEQRQREA